MHDIGLDRLGELLDGELPEDETVLFDGRVRVIGESATDILFSYRGEATIEQQTGPSYEELTDQDYVLRGDDTTFAFRTGDTDYRDSEPTTPVSKGHDERLTVRLDTPEDYRLIVEDHDSIRY
ncbi:MAG: hypothetical protein SVU32_07525 [Candidatus Nanohaloarchaea archaeon]|nr:hypothetical protein [Candidatus Nanohaloarchaea archaeon]